MSKTHGGGLSSVNSKPIVTRAYKLVDCPERCPVRIYNLYNSLCPENRPGKMFNRLSTWVSYVLLTLRVDC